MPGEQPGGDSQSNYQGAGQGSGGNHHDDQQGAGESAHQGGTGGHTTGPNDQSEIEEASQAVQDEDSGMTEDNR